MTMTTTTFLTDRYLASVLKGIPADQRAEVNVKLRQGIETSVLQRTARGEDPQTAERLAIRELGDPMRVSAKYSGRTLSLIGPAFYPEYIRLLKLLVSIVVPIVTVVVGFATALSGEDLWDVVLSALGSGFMVGIQVAFWVTLVFAVIDRRNTDGSSVASDLASEWDLDDLPEMTVNRIGLGDTLASITGLSLLALFLLWQPTYQESLDLGGASIPILNPELSTSWIPVLTIILLASITLEIIKYRTGKWTIPLAGANSLLSLSFAFSAIYLIASDQLLNPEFTAAITAGEFGTFVDLVPTLIAWIIAVITVFDVTEGWWKTVRGRT